MEPILTINISKWIHLFTIVLYLFDTLLSILVLTKRINGENKENGTTALFMLCEKTSKN